MACGGHGYMLISGLPRLYATTVAACTYEGENTVLYLQTARYLLKCLSGEHRLSAKSHFKFLLDPKAPPVKPFNKELYGLDGAAHLVQFYAAATHRELHNVAAKIERLKSDGLTQDYAWNSSQVDLVRLAQTSIQFYLARNYVNWVTQSKTSPELRAVLAQVCQLYLLHGIYENLGRYLPIGLSSEDIVPISALITRLLDDIRPNALPLVDSFDLHDMVLSSALGAYDGQVYERMYECALQAPLNRKAVPDAYKKYLEPFFKSQL